MNVIAYLEVNKDDGTKARINADSVEVVQETSEGLTILTTRVTIKTVGESIDDFWKRLQDARGGLAARVVKAPPAPPKKAAAAKKKDAA